MRKLIETENHLLWESHFVYCTGSNDASAKQLFLLLLCHAPSGQKYDRIISCKETVYFSSFMNFEQPTNLMDPSFLEAVFLKDVDNMLFVKDDDEDYFYSE